MNEVLRNRLVLIFAATLAAAVLFIGLLVMNFGVRDELALSTCQTLNEIMEQQAYNFSSKFEDQLADIRGIAAIFPFGEVSEQETVRLLNGVLTGMPFSGVSVADKSGKALSSAGDHFDVSDRDYFKRAMATGKPVISPPLLSKLPTPGQSDVILIGVPIIRGGETVGVFIAASLASELNKLFLPSFNDKGYAYVTTNEGHIIAKTTNSYSLTHEDNIFEDWAKADFFFGDNLETIKQNLKANKSGHAGYELRGEKRRMHYTTISPNEWNIFSIVPEEVSLEIAGRITALVNVMTFVFVSVFVALVWWLFSMQSKHLKQLSRIAYIDELTGAPTLAKFKKDAAQLLEDNPNTKYLLVKCDIDRFKLINQTFGFAEGDRMLKAVAKAMEASAGGEKETYARVNVDEFMLLHEYISEEHLFARRQIFVDKIKELMGSDFDYNLSFPSGHYYMKAEDYSNLAAAIEKVNFAHKKAKHAGKEVCVYDEEMRKEALNVKTIENRMETALENHEFKVFLQAKYALADEKLAGAEALVRWKFDGGDIVYPNAFIPIFEQNGFITKLDMYMFERVCELIKKWMDSGVEPVTISVNFSRNHLGNSDFAAELCEISDKWGVPRKYLEIELTETAIFDNEELILTVLNKLHKEGFTLSMDDFGTGYSSLGLLKNIPVDVLKIDRGFFLDSPDVERAETVIFNVIRMAKELKIKTVAEGVESKEHIDLLKKYGCDIVQGYYYAKPISCEEFILGGK